jgi:hypothetical protein
MCSHSNRKGLLHAHAEPQSFRIVSGNQPLRRKIMPANIFYIIGVIVVVLFILGYLGLR